MPSLAAEHRFSTRFYASWPIRWFCPPGGAILDPFAGGSVRGIVAGMLGRAYAGIDLRAEQIAAYEAQAAAI